MTALRFFFTVTLRKGDVTQDVAYAREPRRLPVVLSPQEVANLLASAANIKHRAALSVACTSKSRPSASSASTACA